MSQRYFCPAEYTTKTKPKKTNPNPKIKLRVGLDLDLELVLGFGLVCTPLGKNIVDSFFWPHLFLFRIVTQLDTPKSDYRERTGTEWLVLGLGSGSGLGLGLGLVVSVYTNPNLTLKLTTRFQSFLGNLLFSTPTSVV